jgi:hypothetical protein
VGAGVVHDVEVARVVEVEVEVDVVGPDAHADAVFVEEGERGQRAQMLADGQRRDADEADEVGQGRPRAVLESV